MIVIKRRLIFWLLKAYLKKWGKFLLISFLIGLVFFFILKTSFPYIIAAFTGVSKQTIGVVGTYSLENMPPEIVKEVSVGLTKVAEDGTVKPDAASSWDIKDNGKTYIVHLKKNITFNDGTPLTSKEITNTFSQVKIDRPDDYTLVYHLQDPYSPFLVTLSAPIFKGGFVGIGPYRIKAANISGNFLENLTLASTTQAPALKIYQFYPTQDALKVAFALGEINTALNLSSITFMDSTLMKFSHTKVTKSTNYSQLVTLFYNTQDKNLSDKKLRDALSYSLPNQFPEGERAYSSIPPTSWAFDIDTLQRVQDLAHAKLLLEASIGKDTSHFSPLIISTQQKYEKTAELIQSAWKKVGINSKIQIVDSLPPVFQIYLGSFNVPNDPDQYTLWHSYQGNNISNYRNLRIDKLLEDGRTELNQADRTKTYIDFQKYLEDDQPATFLYFPYNYTVERI